MYFEVNIPDADMKRTLRSELMKLKKRLKTHEAEMKRVLKKESNENLIEHINELRQSLNLSRQRNSDLENENRSLKEKLSYVENRGQSILNREMKIDFRGGFDVDLAKQLKELKRRNSHDYNKMFGI